MHLGLRTKKAIVRWFVEELPRAKYKTPYIPDSELTPRNVYWECLNQLGIKPRFYRGDAKRQLNAVLVDMAEGQGKTPVVIIDEAHLLSHQMLEEIRFLTNFRMDSYSPMSLILVGQTELLAALQRPSLLAISQRVSNRWHLPYFDLSETARYIEHNLKIAGVTTPLFTDGAIKVIHEATQGAARAIGGLSCSCLLHAMSANAKLVDDHSVKLVKRMQIATQWPQQKPSYSFLRPINSGFTRTNSVSINIYRRTVLWKEFIVHSDC